MIRKVTSRWMKDPQTLVAVVKQETDGELRWLAFNQIKDLEKVIEVLCESETSLSQSTRHALTDVHKLRIVRGAKNADIRREAAESIHGLDYLRKALQHARSIGDKELADKLTKRVQE
jgi:cell division septum initiation protein DivIVA